MPLLLLLLFLCCASVCVAQKDGGVQSTGVVRELPHKGQSGVQAYTVATQENEGWELIRIEAFTKDLENPSEYCRKVNENNVRDRGMGCQTSMITPDQKKDLEEKIIPAAKKLHEDRLFVRRGSGKLKVPLFEVNNDCKHFTVPKEHRTEGVDADFVLYVAAVPLSSFGVTCAVENSTGRPIVGAVNYAPTQYEFMRFDVRRVAHEIAHALGFNLPEMERKGIVTEVELRGAKRKVVSSTKTVEKAQKHYNCSNLKGMELEVYSYGTQYHWARRIAKDELMASSYFNNGGYYTALTMALFEDLQYYKANWGMEEQMSWGNQSGCDFLEKKCMENNITRYPQYFCNETIFRCTSDRLAYGNCHVPSSLYAGNEDICQVTEDRVVFHIEKSVSLPFALCTRETETNKLPGSIMGPDSWCLDAELTVKGDAASAFPNQKGVCARVLCDYEKRTVKVQYKGKEGENILNECHENKMIDVQFSESASGKIKCPKYDEVCTIAFNGSSLVPFVVNRPKAPSAAAEKSTSTADHAPASTSSATNSMSGSRSRRDIGADVNPSTTSENIQNGATSPSGKENANTNALSQYPGVVNQAQINNMQNESKLLIELAKDDALSAVCSLPIMIVTMVLAVVLSC